jgi:ubiquinone/menaquinone biosynthesis C-methylase UbiE
MSLNQLDARRETPEAPAVQHYGALAADYDSTRYDGTTNAYKEQLRRQALLGLLPAHVDRALDVACGTGRGVSLLTSIARVACGVDGTAEMLAVAHQKLNGQQRRASLFQANAATLPFIDAAFDAVTCLNFLHLFPQLDAKRAFIREIGRVVRPGGVAVIEFDNALQGLVLGIGRKYFGRDIGYDWPWIIRRSFPAETFIIETVRGTNLPGTWRVPGLRALEQGARYFPLNYLATRLLVQARRK